MTTELMTEKLKTVNILTGYTNIDNLYSSAINNNIVTLLDCMTVRDLVSISGYRDDAGLTAVLICMFSSLNQGGLCLRISNTLLTNKFKRFFDINQASKYADKFIECLNNDKYSDIIASDKEVYFPVIRQYTDDDDLLYFRKYFVHENSLNEHLKLLIQSNSTNRKDSPNHAAILEEIIDKRPVCLSTGNSIQLDDDQKLAIRKTLTDNFIIISGGPGTGKTSILVNILRGLVKDGIPLERIMIAAPTGRAAQRVTESIQSSLELINDPDEIDINLKNIKSTTIHRLLKYNPSRNSFVYNPGNLLQADVIIVDEVSMVDVVLMDNLLGAINLENTKVILLGDRNQLPSVEAGAVLTDLITGNKEDIKNRGNVILLNTDYRSKGEIRKLAKAIINKDDSKDVSWPDPVSITEALQTTTGSYSLLKNPDKTDIVSTITAWVDCFYIKPDKSGKSYAKLVRAATQLDIDNGGGKKTRNTLDSIFNYLENSIILSLVREGTYGCIGLNKMIAKHLKNHFNSSGNSDGFVGMPVLITRNNYTKDLFNGDIGVMLKDRKGSNYVVFKKYGNFVTHPLESLPPHEPAFAITVHKSQGSEFDNVMIILPDDEEHPLLTREIIYTGVTRAKKRLFIYGNSTSLNKAVNRKIERESGLSLK